MADTTYTPKVYRKQGGDELVVADGGRVTIESGGFIARNLTGTALATAGAGTYTAALIAAGIIERDCAGGARTDTTDTAVNIIAALGLSTVGDSYTFYVINTSDAAEAITMAGGTDVTFLNAAQTLAQNESAQVVLVLTAAATLDAYIIGA